MLSIKPRIARLLWVLALVVAVFATVFAVLRAFNDNLVLFYTPTQLVTGEIPTGRSYRLGGMVEKSSLVREPGSTNVTFKITDMVNTVPVTFSGLPLKWRWQRQNSRQNRRSPYIKKADDSP